MSGSTLLTVSEVAAELRMDPWTVRQKIARGELPAINVGGDEARSRRYRIRRDVLDTYLDERSVANY